MGEPIKHQIPTTSHVDPQPLDCYVDYELKVVEIANSTIGEDKLSLTDE